MCDSNWVHEYFTPEGVILYYRQIADQLREELRRAQFRDEASDVRLHVQPGGGHSSTTVGKATGVCAAAEANLSTVVDEVSAAELEAQFERGKKVGFAEGRAAASRQLITALLQSDLAAMSLTPDERIKQFKKRLNLFLAVSGKSGATPTPEKA